MIEASLTVRRIGVESMLGFFHVILNYVLVIGSVRSDAFRTKRWFSLGSGEGNALVYLYSSPYPKGSGVILYLHGLTLALHCQTEELAADILDKHILLRRGILGRPP